jgi:hypothetical protein
LVTGALALVVVTILAVTTSRGTARHDREGDGTAEVAVRGDTSNDMLMRSARRPTAGQIAGAFLLLLETAFLVAAGAQLWSSSTDGARPTLAVTSLVRAVGAGSVGFGVFTCFAGPGVSSLGVLPESNILFGLNEFDFYDPVLPRGYFQSWAAVSNTSPGAPIFNSFCPALTTAAEARRFGVQFVLEPEDAAAPTGAAFDERIGNEDLYRIPDSAEAVLTPTPRTGKLPPADASGVPVTVDHSSPSSLSITTSSRIDQVLRLRLTDEPGWHATIDGRPLQLEPFAGVMFQARIPSGHHVIELHYWPTLFTVGLIVAGICVLLFVTYFVVTWAIRRRATQGRARLMQVD